MKKPRTVELVKSSYQPSKAELEEEIPVRPTGETVMDRVWNLPNAMPQPIKPRWIDRPRSRR